MAPFEMADLAALVQLGSANRLEYKSRTNVMLGFKRFRSAATTISGIELTHRIRKGQFDLTKLGLKEATAPAIWDAVLSAR
jgi:transposase-like protein